MAWDHIELAVDESVATITLNRPEALNAFVGTMRADLLAAIDEAAERARVLVVTGAGKAFCSGGDVRAMAKLRVEASADALKPLIEQGAEVVKRLRALPIPSLAAVNGVAAGAGFSLALACDLRIASSAARFGASFTRVGLHPDWGATYSLTRLAGAAVARDLVFTGRLIGSEEALRLGLVSEVVDSDALAARTREKALELAAAAPTSIRYAREAIARAEHASLEDRLDFEKRAQLDCFRTEDALEGLHAFIEKRPAKFKGK
jgi:2-(1,2-epoxy-1,2-dihydrophenyl)acetyl-CoA isomerase